MGGRGASLGISVSGKKYGTEYSTVLKESNIKFVIQNEGNTNVPFETMTRGRVYVTVDRKTDKLKSISYYDNEGKRRKQIDLDHKHNDEKPHVHHGYWHNENDTDKGYSKLMPEEKRIVEFVEKTWNNKKTRK